MVAIKNSEADSFFKKGLGHTFCYLVFGTDDGLVRERIRSILKLKGADPVDSFQLTKLDGDDCYTDPSKLADEVYAISMFGGSRIVWVEVGAKSILPILEPILNSPPAECILILQAGVLKSESTLRRFISMSKNSAAIECYPDNQVDLLRLIDKTTAEANLSIDQEAKELLATLLGSDRMASRGEIEKLCLYCADKNKIDADDILTIIVDASKIVLEKTVQAIFLSHTNIIDEALKQYFASGQDPSILLSAVMRYAINLHRARLDFESGKALESCTAILMWNKSDYKSKLILENQLQCINSTQINHTINMLARSLEKIRRQPVLGKTIATRVMWQIARQNRNHTLN